VSDERHECDNCERYVHGWAVDAERAERAEAEVARLRARILAIDTGKVLGASQVEVLQDEIRRSTSPQSPPKEPGAP
jgi:hypothetical protein